MAQRSTGDAEPAHVLSYPDTEGAWGGRPGRASRRERKGASYLGFREHLPQLSHRPQPTRSVLQGETPAGPSRACAPAWEEALTGRRASCWLPGE